MLFLYTELIDCSAGLLDYPDSVEVSQHTEQERRGEERRGQGRAGQGRAGQGREGKGREGKGREGHFTGWQS